MTKRIDTLTDAQRATFGAYADQWIARGWRTGPMDDAEWAKVQDAIRACYRYAGQSEPKVIVRVPSPLVGALAAPIAAFLIELRKRGAVGGAVDDAVHGAVHDAVDGAVRKQVRQAVAYVLRTGWYRRFGGQHWSGWMAWRLWFRDHGGLDLAGDLWDRAQAYADANVAGYWWAYRDFAMVAERPTVLHVEQVAPTGWGSHRLHCETGPAVAWADGTAVHAWHGTRVPADLIEGAGWDTTRILQERNTEVRRCAIERLGWDRFVTDARLEQVGQTVPDPGNPGQTLSLYDVPERIYGDADVRVLLCTNGTVECDGTRRRFGLTVPAEIGDPVAAAAWGYGITADLYATAARRA